jgi:hypothetical protein
MFDIADGLTKISKVLNLLDPIKGNLTCEITGKPPVTDCSEGIGARGSNDPKAHLIICSSMEKSPENQLVQLFIHESAHATGFLKDFAYSNERIFDFIPVESKLQMPDGYVGVTLELNKVIRNEAVEVPTIGKPDKINCSPAQIVVAKGALALLDRWIADARTSIQQLYDKSDLNLLPDHIKTVKTHFDPGFNGTNLEVIEALYARFEELSFGINNELEINCITKLDNILPLGGFWQESSTGFPGSKVFLFSDYFVLAVTQEKAALLQAEMLAEASGFIESKHRKVFGPMARDFSKTQDKNPWRKK